MEIKFKYKNRGFEINVKKCNAFMRFKGLMFSRRKNAEALLFDFKKPVKMAIHSFFVFFPFVAVWLDEQDEVIEKKVIYPFRPFILPKKEFSKLIEIPINKKYNSVVKNLLEK